MTVGSLTSAQNTALTGINASMQGIRSTAENMANINTEEFSKKTFDQSTAMIGGRGGVNFSQLRRVSDERLVADIHKGTAQLSESETKSFYLDRMEQFFGSANTESGFMRQFTKFSSSIQSLNVKPADLVLQRQVVAEASNFAKTVNSVANGVQKLRGEIDAEIYDTIALLNTELVNIFNFSRNIISGKANGQDVSAFEDGRDAAVGRVGDMLGVKTLLYGKGNMGLFTHDGTPLINQAPNVLSYTGVAKMSPNVTYPDSIQGIMMGGHDITHSITTGKLKALIDLRDSILPAHQSELDTLTKAVRDEINEVHNLGTGLPPPTELVGTTKVQLMDGFSGSGKIRISFVDEGGDFTVLPVEVELSSVSTIQGLINAINTATGETTASLSSSHTLKIQAPPGSRVAIVAMGDAPAIETTTNKGFSHYFGLNDLFLTSSSIESIPDVGIANTLAVRPDIIRMPSLLSRSTANKSEDVSIDGEPAQKSGISPLSNTIVLKMSEKLQRSDIAFPSSGRISAYSGSLVDYTSTILTMVSSETDQSEKAIKVQKSMVESLESSLSSLNGVNEEEELAKLILYQQSYRASAKMMQVVEEMLVMIVDIIRVR